MKTTGRNDPCPCGSGKKYKKCCLENSAGEDAAPLVEPIEAVIDTIDALSNQVPDLLAAGRLEEAQRVARRLLADYPDEPDGIERMAEVLEAMGRPRQAAEYYRKAARHHIDPDAYGQEAAAYYLENAERLDPQGPAPAGGPSERG